MGSLNLEKTTIITIKYKVNWVSQDWNGVFPERPYCTANNVWWVILEVNDSKTDKFLPTTCNARGHEALTW